MARGNTQDPRRPPDPSIPGSGGVPDPRRGPVTQDPHRGSDPSQFHDPAVATTNVNGWTVPAGSYEHSYDGAGNPVSRWVPFTKTQLQAEADRAASQAASGGFHPASGRGSSPAPPKPNPKSPGAKNVPNFGATVAQPNAFDNFASGRGGVDYSKAQIADQYAPIANVQPITSRFPGDFPGRNQETGPPSTDSLENLLRNFVDSGKANVAKVQQQLIDAGFGNSIHVTGIADGTTIQAYKGMLENTLTLQAAGQHITPDDFLAGLAKAGKSKTTTTNTYSITNPVQARGAITTAFGDKLGRKPTDSEVAAFTQALNAYEQANPRSDTTVTDPSGNVKSASELDKGTGSLNFVNDFAANYSQTDPSVQPEYHAAQALDFYNAALSTLAGGGINTGNTD